MYAEAIHQAILATYLQPLQALIDRRAKYYLALNAKDPFAMTDEEARRWQQRIQEIGQEIETLENVRSSISDMHQIYQPRLERVDEAEKTIALLRHTLHQVMLDYITFRQMFESEAEVTETLLKHSILSIQKSKAA